MSKPTDERIGVIIHDVKHCLHVIQMGLDVLKLVREDETRFKDVCDMIEKEREQAKVLLSEFARLARQLSPSESSVESAEPGAP